MTIRLQPRAKGEKYKLSDYQPLEHHYHERILQVHVMSEFARRGIERIQEAIGLVLAYFSLGKEEFIRRYLNTKPELLRYATTAESYQRIVTDLANATQIKVVSAPVGRNLLILAGPGSGKTKTVVHRCAYLLRVERARPQSILVCCFNRHAAIELRRRLRELAGDDAKGVTVLTYHGLALRLLGHSFAGHAERTGPEIDFDALITDAVRLLRGDTTPPGLEADEVRYRLLAGFQHILVDEHGLGLFDQSGLNVARLSRKAEAVWVSRLPAIRDFRVLAMAGRTAAQDTDPTRRENYLVSEWEIPIVEITFSDASAE